MVHDIVAVLGGNRCIKNTDLSILVMMLFFLHLCYIFLKRQRGHSHSWTIIKETANKRMLGLPDGFYYPQSRDKNEEGKQTRQRKRRWAESLLPLQPWGKRDRQLGRGLGECSLFSHLCLHVGSDEAILWGVISEVTMLAEYGVMLKSFSLFFPPWCTAESNH